MRRILCRECGEDYKLVNADLRLGFKIRRAYITSTVPKEHGVTVNGVFNPVADILCDLCGDRITGQVCVAVTVWRGTEPKSWESEYGTILPPPAVAVIDTLTKK